MSDEYDRGAPIDREAWAAETSEDDDTTTGGGETDTDTATVSAREADADLLSRFDHEGIVCELGETDGTFYGFVRLPPSIDRLRILWDLDPPGRFGYGPDADGWIGFETPRREGVEPREAAVALAGLAVQVAERARSAPE